MDFTETLTIALPKLDDRILEFAEQRGPLRKGLVIEVAAIHEGMTANYNNYPAMELAAALPSWTSPYPKPILLHHDPYSEAIGRIVGARMDSEDDGTPYTRLQAAITGTEAIQKVLDQRYLTGSVGGKAGKAKCSVCEADWSKASMFDLPCKHQRGKTYNGKLATIEMGDISFKEYSFVNMPADQKSGVRAVHAPLESEGEPVSGEFHPARFYLLDMVTEGITEVGESERDVLEGLQTQHATSLYLGLKSAFLSALHEDTRQNKENGMGVKPQDETPPEAEEDDVLAVAESLSDDLSAKPADSEGDEESSEEEPPVAEEEAEGEESEGDEGETGDEGTDEGEDKGEEGEEAGSEEGTEPTAASDEPVGDTGDEDTNSSDGAEEEEVTPSESTEGTLVLGSTSTPTFTVTSGNTTYTTTGTAVSGGNYTIMVQPDPQVAELTQQVTSLTESETKLKEENTRLRAALKKGLAERVVDMKIALGVHEAEEREQALSEHLERSAGSLADTLRDLAAMPAMQRDYQQVPRVSPTGAAIGGDSDREPISGETSTSPKPDEPEDIFVDVLMGRRSL
jgi:hypothetical protein